MNEKEYKCSICKNIYKKGLTDEDAERQFKKEFPLFKRNETDAIVCDDCYTLLFGD